MVSPVVLISLLGLSPIGNLSDRDFFAIHAINQSLIKRLGQGCALSYLMNPFNHARLVIKCDIYCWE